MPTDPDLIRKTRTSRTVAVVLGWIVAWTWAIVAGGGGAALLWMKGPWPPTNGWFALLSGIAACPLTASLLKKYMGVTVSVRVRIAAAVLFIVAGRIALSIWPHDVSRAFVL